MSSIGTRLRRTASVAALVLVAAIVACIARTADAQDDDAPRCVCEHRDACYHFLNAPVDPPDDPDPCERCAAGHRHHAGDGVPAGWNAACMASNRMACFLKRHAVSWQITCNRCLANDSCCPLPGQDTCPACGDGEHTDPLAKDALRQDARASMAERLVGEERFFDRKNVVIAYSRHFYVVTDIRKIRLAIPNSAKTRWTDGHEYAHLMVQRAEQAYDELSEVLGGRIKLLRPMGIYLPESERVARKLQEVYFRAARTHMIYSSYGGSSESAISEGFCLNGLCVPLERVKQSAAATRSPAGDDYALHGSMRHLIAHVLSTCWIVRNGENRTMPRWAFVGLAHWFGKRLGKHRDVVYYCTGEDQRISGSGKEWREDLLKSATRGDLIPIEELLGASSLGHLDFEAHRQLWGYFEIALASEDWRGPWIDLLADLRDEKDVRAAFQARLGMTPEAFHDAWLARLTGRDAEPTPDDEAPQIDPSRAPTEIAAAIRSLAGTSDPAVVARILDTAGLVKSDLVRETALTVLLELTDAAARRAIWEVGLAAPRPMTRAIALRAVRGLGLADAKLAVRGLLADSDWLVRSEAALAASALHDFDAQSGMRALTRDSSPKVRIGAMDALVGLGEDVNSTCIPLVIGNLAHERWQVRLAAAQALGAIGSEEAVTGLVERLDQEGGRVQEALFEALRAISGEDFGNVPERWRKWWEIEQPHVRERGGFAVTGPSRPPEEPGRYAPEETPRYYGQKLFSQRVAFVLDTSRSTNRNFRADPETRERLLGKYDTDTLKITQIAARELEAGVAALDPRARFNVILFSDRAAAWQDSLVPASAGNKRSAASFARSRAPAGETNFHAALLLALEAGESPWTSSDLRNTADTVTFLTDGSPTVGDLTDPEDFVRWFGEVNRYARARLHVIAFGNLGVNESFLQRLAAGSRGSFTQLLESSPR